MGAPNAFLFSGPAAAVSTTARMSRRRDAFPRDNEHKLTVVSSATLDYIRQQPCQPSSRKARSERWHKVSVRRERQPRRAFSTGVLLILQATNKVAWGALSRSCLKCICVLYLHKQSTDRVLFPRQQRERVWLCVGTVRERRRTPLPRVAKEAEGRATKK